MRRNIELYIGRMKADLSDTNLILMTYTMDDLRNPTILKNSYSQQIELQSTPNNDKIFGGIWRSDRRTTGGEGTGVDFDASKKTSFVIFGDGELLESGYVKLDSIESNRDKRVYHISLYGGMGEFLQQLTYDSDGEKMNLASLYYGASLDFTINKETIINAWNGIESNVKWQRINFAPCYNGFPNDFDADKVLIAVSSYPYLDYYYYEEADDGTQTRYESRGGYVNLSINKEATEWEMQELRSYCQRPVLRLKFLIQAICDNTNYDVELDSLFFNDTNPYWEDTWITLPMITDVTELVDNDDSVDYPRSGASITKEMLLSGDKTPAEYLVSFCKLFGLHIVCDNEMNKVKILTRTSLYQYYLDVIDIEKNVDVSRGVKVTPLPYDSKWYTFAQEMKGEFAENYKETNGAEYGAFRVDTGYQFSQEEKPLLSSLAFKGAVEVLEKSKLYLNYTTNYYGTINKVPSAILAGGTYQLFNIDGGTVDMDITFPNGLTGAYFNATYPGFDAFPKVQFHEKDNKNIDGRDVILFFKGNKDVSGIYSNLRVTDDHLYMDTLNEGKPCWYYTNYNDDYSTIITSLPMFGRYKMSGDTITDSLDFGTPYEIGIPGVAIPEDTSLYYRYWRSYILDRYNTDSRVIKVHLLPQGLPQGNELLRRFVYFQGAVWCVNKIINQSLTSEETTEVELIKVQDIQNYI